MPTWDADELAQVLGSIRAALRSSQLDWDMRAGEEWCGVPKLASCLQTGDFSGSAPSFGTPQARRNDGSADPRFGSRGRARIHTPWKGPNATPETMVSVNRASPRTIVVIATQDGRKQLQVIRVRL